jgi:hypothetical protein
MDPLYRSFAAEVNRAAYMLELEELNDATGLGLAATALLTKALSPPRTNAATPAMMITRKVPRLRGCWLRLVDVDIFLTLSVIYEDGSLSATDPMNISKPNLTLL